MTWVNEYRKLFPAAEKCVYMDSSYDCGGSLLCRDAVCRFFDDWAEAAADNERGGPGRARFFRVADQTREILGRFLGGVPGSRIAFTKNTNEGINAILQGFDFEEGDQVLAHCMDHESVLMPCLNARRLRGVDCRILQKESHYITAEDLMAAAGDHTRMIVVSHVQPATGYRLDLEKLGAFCRRRGIFLVVDAIQSMGILQFQAEKWGVSAVSGASYKWLGGTNSLGYLYLSEELAGHVTPVFTAAGSYMDLARDEKGYHLVCLDETRAGKLENSSLDNVGIYALNAAVREIERIGLDAIWAHVSPLAGKLAAGLADQGWTVVTPMDASSRCSIVSIFPEEPVQEVFDHFRSCGIVLSIAHGSYIRFGIAPFTIEEDIDAVLDAAGRYWKRKEKRA